MGARPLDAELTSPLPHPDVTVLGAGISGLTSALALLEAGLGVQVWAASPPQATTSAVAAAVWYPYRAAPQDHVTRWAGHSLQVLTRLADDPATGVWLRTGLDLTRAGSLPDPWWREAVPGLRPCPPEEVPAGYTGAWQLRVPIAEMPTYLRWLTDEVHAAGGRIVEREVTRIDDVDAASPVIVNATGLGARRLVGDDTLFPVRGQVVRVANPGLTRFLLDEHHPEGPTYVIPRGTDCVLGGTAEEGRWDTEPDPAVSDEILRRCRQLEPRLRDAEVLGHAAGLRPGRGAVRVEAERFGHRLVVHNYGHGGAGVTLSWGCAAEVVGLVRDHAGMA